MRAIDFKAQLGTLAIKGDVEHVKVGRYGWFGKPAVKITRENLDDILPMVAEWHHQKLVEQGLGQAVLVPLPSSSSVPGSGDFRSALLARQIAAASGGALWVNDQMRFKAVMQKSREGGPRDKGVLLGSMTLPQTPLPPRAHVLVDDVCTSGGHLFAAQELLRRRGLNVTVALVGGRTVHEPADTMISPEPEVITTAWF